MKYAGGGTWSGHAQQDFGRGSEGQNGKYGEMKEVWEEKEVRECGTRHKQSNMQWLGRPYVEFRHSGVHSLGTMSGSPFEGYTQPILNE